MNKRDRDNILGFIESNEDARLALGILNGNDEDITVARFAKALRSIADSIDNIKYDAEEYLNLWPKIKLPTGYYARCSVKDIEKAFKAFYKRYKYPWNIVIKATKNYLEDRARNAWEYCKTSQYFIIKNDMSTLASECESILNGEDNEVKFKTKVV